MLRLLFALACLLGSAAAQRTFFCNSTGSGSIADRDFYLVTRRQGEASYPRDFSCGFASVTDTSSTFLVEVVESDMSSALLTIKSNGLTILRTRRLDPEHSSHLTQTRTLQVLFETAGGDSGRAKGVVMRVRAVRKADCPPGWSQLSGTCFGASATSGRLDFEDAQKACKNMLANLLHVPVSGRVEDLLRQLPASMTKNNSWIGLTNIRQQSSYVWLNGSLLYREADIGCLGGGTCASSQRCAAAAYPTSYTVYMASCSTQLQYICYMPPGGSNRFYSIPSTPWPTASPGGSYGSSSGLEWWQVLLIIFGCILFLSCCGAGGYRKRTVIVSYFD